MTLPYTFDDDLIKMLRAPKPLYLYKYHPMNLHLIEMLTNAKFYMSKKSDLNDPLDLTYPISLENYLNLYFEKNSSLERDPSLIEILSSCFNRDVERGCIDWTNDFEELKFKLRVSCFTEDGNNPLMWAHYAHNHTGVCLKFDMAGDIDLEKILYPISYKDELIEVEKISDFTKCLLTKLKAWSIEKEWRIISEKERISFKNGTLVEIVFGLNVSDSTVRWFKQFLENVYFMHTSICKLKIKENRIVKVDEWGDELNRD